MLWGIDPWGELERMRRDLDNVFTAGGRPDSNCSFPLVNVYDNKDNIIVNAELPGFTKEKVNITFSDGTLTLSGKQEPQVKGKGVSVIREERPVGEFEKSFRIPVKVEQDKINATFTNGILSITLPKSAEAKPKQIQIQAK